MTDKKLDEEQLNRCRKSATHFVNKACIHVGLAYLHIKNPEWKEKKHYEEAMAELVNVEMSLEQAKAFLLAVINEDFKHLKLKG